MSLLHDDFLITPEQLLGIKKIKRIRSENEVTLEMIEDGYKTAAYVVTHYGDVYLPIFERMEHELKKRESLIALKERAFVIAKENQRN